MIDLGIYLAGLGLGLEETLVGLCSPRMIDESGILIHCNLAMVDDVTNGRSG